ncbi:MAG TPA: response regulator [Candidatus Limnocylindrales bacterium]|nr:response regulator [Candidatus Limnocylindrales bacterium]
MPKVLIAEDESVLRDAYVMILGHAGYRVVPAVDGRDTLDKLEKERPELLILDMLMPGLSGLEVLKHQRMQPLRPGLKIIAFTNLSDPKTLLELERQGVDKYLLKSSIQPRMLISHVAEVLAQEPARASSLPT